MIWPIITTGKPCLRIKPIEVCATGESKSLQTKFEYLITYLILITANIDVIVESFYSRQQS